MMLGQVALGVGEIVGGIPEDEIGVGEALQVDGVRRIEAATSEIVAEEAAEGAEVVAEDASGLSKAAGELDPADRGGELTKASRALQKHGSRQGSVFPRASGNPSEINAQGQQVADGIINDSGSVTEPNRFGGTNIRAPDGRGISYNADGSFRGFLEP